MADTTYRVIKRDDGTFAVEITSSGALPQTAAGFATETEARGWIAQDERFRVAAAPFGSRGNRKWRGQ
jgi:hypothetical protein